MNTKFLSIVVLPLLAVAVLAVVGCQQNADTNGDTSASMSAQASSQMVETTCPCGAEGKTAFTATKADGTVQEYCCGNCESKDLAAEGATLNKTCCCGKEGSMAHVTVSGDGKVANAYCSAECQALVEGLKCEKCKMSGGLCDACKAKVQAAAEAK